MELAKIIISYTDLRFSLVRTAYHARFITLNIQKKP